MVYLTFDSLWGLEQGTHQRLHSTPDLIFSEENSSEDEVRRRCTARYDTLRYRLLFGSSFPQVPWRMFSLSFGTELLSQLSPETCPATSQ